MTNEECNMFKDGEIPCYTRVSGVKVKVVIIGKKEDASFSFGERKAQTEWTIKRVDNGKILHSRNCRALHKTMNFEAD